MGGTNFDEFACTGVGWRGPKSACHGRPTQILIKSAAGIGNWGFTATPKTYCLELRPSMESTGFALHALSGHVTAKDVQHSLDYLAGELPRTRTPLWLGWSLLALPHLGNAAADSESWIEDSLARQTDYGSYDTAWISLLLLAARCERGVDCTCATTVAFEKTS